MPNASQAVFMVQRCYTEPEVENCGVFSTREKACEFIAVESAKLDPKAAAWPPWDVVEWVVDEEATAPKRSAGT